MIEIHRQRDEWCSEAMNALALRVGATWRHDKIRHHATMQVEDRSVHVIGTVAFGARRLQRPARLRFDKVALSFARRITSSIEGLIPDGRTLLIGCTAPIREAARTASEIIECLRSLYSASGDARPVPDEVNGNRITMYTAFAKSNAKALVFVHNPDVDGMDILLTVETLLRTISRAYDAHHSSPVNTDLWLVLLSLPAELGAMSQVVYPHLRDKRFQRVFATTRDGRLEELSR